MEYAEFIDINPETLLNDSFTRYSGYQDTSTLLQTNFFNINTVNKISKKITELLHGVDPQNRPIVVPNTTITNIMDSVYMEFRPETGDIFTRYIMPSGLNSDDYINNMIDQTVEIIFSEVKNNMDMEQNNKKLSAWVQVLGDFNDNNLRAYPPIKILHKHPAHFQFNMMY